MNQLENASSTCSKGVLQYHQLYGTVCTTMVNGMTRAIFSKIQFSFTTEFIAIRHHVERIDKKKEKSFHPCYDVNKIHCTSTYARLRKA